MESSRLMSHADFVHLRVHSAYSLSEGAIKIDALAELCRQNAMPAVAVTDSGNLFGAMEVALALPEAGVQPIIGCQLAIRREDGETHGSPVMLLRPDTLVLLVQSETGYRNLLKLVSAAFLNSEPGEAPQIGLGDLEGASDGLIALTGGPEGTVGRMLLDGQDPAAEATLDRLSRLFPGRLYVEVSRHGLPQEREIEDRLIALAYGRDLPLVATNEAFFADADMYEAHDALLCIAEGTYVGQSDRRRLTPNHRFTTAAEMRALFADLPEALDNTLVIARRCAFHPEPVAPILPAFPTEAGRSEPDELRTQAAAGLVRRLETRVFTADLDPAARAQVARSYEERLDYELAVIEQMGFPGYFLIVADIIKWAKEQGIPVGPGRGSGAGSVVAWSLTITDLNPLRWDLLFERFLNPERVSMPDFDMDFCQDRRDEVIRYVQGKYGVDRVAQIITFGKLQARAVLRDVGRVLQMPYPQVDRICKLVPSNPANPVSLQQAIDGEPQLQEMIAGEETVARLVDIALKLEGLYRHASTHAAGLVIGDRPLEQLIPLYRDPRSDMSVTQFSMKYVEMAGLVKFDFLGLKTLSVLDRATELIRESVPDFDLSKISLKDPKTYDLLARADTVGVFQLESAGMRDVLRQLKADRFEEIIAVVALYRPGPMDNIPSFLNRASGKEAPDYLYPSLEGILKETFGIMVYQEQVMQIAQELAGFSLGGADLLRRAMGKKIRSEMEAQRKTFEQGAVARGVPKAKATEIFEQINKFAGYGFVKSHAAAYALIAYQTGFLKANYPVEFLAASMTYDLGNTDKLNVFGQELARLRIPLLPPDVNASRQDFGVERLPDGRRAIRYALAAVKNVGESAMAGLVAERQSGGPFRDLGDFARRLDARQVNKRQIESLASAGTFDGINDNRRQVYEAAEVLVRHAAVAAEDKVSGQVSLFGDGEDGAETRLPLPTVEDWPAMARLRHEFEAIGFYLSAHPLDAFGETLGRLGVVAAVDLEQDLAREPGRKKLAGILIGKQERTSRSGNRFAFVQFSDKSGVFEAVVFTELLGRSRELLESGGPLLLTVAVEVRTAGEPPRLTLQDVDDLELATARRAGGLRVYVNDPERLENLKSVLGRAKGEAAEANGRPGRVQLVLDLAARGEVEMELPGAYRLPAEIRQAIKAIPGVNVQDL